MAADSGLPAGSRAVLIGVSAYEYAEFPPIRAARNSLQAMQSLLAGPALCGWPPELITVIPNPVSAADLADRIADLAEATTGVLLLYYVGHGVLSTRGELCLTRYAEFGISALMRTPPLCRPCGGSMWRAVLTDGDVRHNHSPSRNASMSSAGW